MLHFDFTYVCILQKLKDLFFWKKRMNLLRPFMEKQTPLHRTKIISK